jgi:hypothetical protein
MPDDDLLQRPIVDSWIRRRWWRNFFLLSLHGSRLSRRVPFMSSVGKRPRRASASKTESSVMSEISGPENVVFNHFIDDVLDSEDVSVSEQRASASLPDSVPIETEEECAAREEDEMAALDAVGDYEADPTVMLEDVPQDIVLQTLKVWCAWTFAVLVFACVCVCARARDVDMCS